MSNTLDHIPQIVGKTISRSYTQAYGDGQLQHVVEFTDGCRWVARSIEGGKGRMNAVYPTPAPTPVV